MPDDTNTPSLPVGPSAPGGVASNLHALVLVACPDHPGRVGESCTFSDLHLEHVFGRGSGNGSELRVDLRPWRSGFAGAAVPFEDATLSRRLLEVVPRPFGFEVKNLAEMGRPGRPRMRLAGVETNQGGVTFGETIQIDEKFLFYATRRPARLDTIGESCDRREDIPLIVHAIALSKIDAIPSARDRFVETRPDGTRFVRIGIDLSDALMVSEHPTNERGLESIVLTSIERSQGRTLRAYQELWDATRRHARRNLGTLASPGEPEEPDEGE
jgi:hypothetical protein